MGSPKPVDFVRSQFGFRLLTNERGFRVPSQHYLVRGYRGAEEKWELTVKFPSAHESCKEVTTSDFSVLVRRSNGNSLILLENITWKGEVLYRRSG